MPEASCSALTPAAAAGARAASPAPSDVIPDSSSPAAASPNATLVLDPAAPTQRPGQAMLRMRFSNDAAVRAVRACPVAWVSGVDCTSELLSCLQDAGSAAADAWLVQRNVHMCLDTSRIAAAMGQATCRYCSCLWALHETCFEQTELHAMAVCCPWLQARALLGSLSARHSTTHCDLHSAANLRLSCAAGRL